ncbi:MAG: MFS transporter [Anaerolineae bacterium]|nr:MFS transporter [Anaerolineae bacterium]
MLRSNVSRVVLLTFLARLHFYLYASTIFLQDRGLSLFEVNAIDTIVLLAVFVAEVPTGVIADRIGRKWSVVIGMLLHATGELLVLFGYSFAAFAVMAAIIGTGFAFESGAWESLVYDTLPEEDRENAMKRAMGSIGSAANLGFVISPLIGTLIVAHLAQSEFAVAIVLTASSIFLAALVALTLHEPESAHRTAKTHPWVILRSGLAEVRGSRPLQHIALVSICLSFGGALIALAPPYFVAHQAPSFLIGLSLALGSLLATFTQKYAYKLETLFGKRAGLVIAALLPGVGYLLLAAATGAASILALVILVYGAGPIKTPLLSAYQNAHISSSTRATVLSLINMVAHLWIAIGTLISGAAADRSIPLVFAGTGLLIIAVTILLRVDRIPLEVVLSEKATPDAGRAG